MIKLKKKHRPIIIFLTICIAVSVIVYFMYISGFNSRELQMRNIGQYTSPNYPPIHYYDNLFTDEECQQIIDIAQPQLSRSTLGVNNDTSEERTSQQAWLKKTQLPCLERCSNQIAKITKLPVENQEDWQVLRYEPGQEYTPHFDACQKEDKKFQTCIQDEKDRGWGKRVYTFFIYLNDVEDGGETYFPLLDKKFKPKKGTAILWNNLTDDQLSAHPYSKHSGMPVKKGTKWAINVWIRQHPKKY